MSELQTTVDKIRSSWTDQATAAEKEAETIVGKMLSDLQESVGKGQDSITQTIVDENVNIAVVKSVLDGLTGIEYQLNELNIGKDGTRASILLRILPR